MTDVLSEEKRVYKKRDKRRFVKLAVDGTAVTMPPEEVQSFMDGSDPTEYTVNDVWLTQDEFEALPEFQGF